MPKVKRVSITLSSTRDYLELMNGFFDLTDMEMRVLSEFIKERYRRKKRNVDPTVHLFHSSVKRKISKTFEKNNHYWINSYVMQLKEKGALIPQGEEGHYKIHPGLIFQGEDRIVININWNIDDTEDT